MADKEESDVLEEVEEDSRKGVSKPLIIKIAVAVVLVLAVAAGAYFMMGSDTDTTGEDTSSSGETATDAAASSAEETADTEPTTKAETTQSTARAQPAEKTVAEDNTSDDSAAPEIQETISTPLLKSGQEDQATQEIELPEIPAENSAAAVETDKPTQGEAKPEPSALQATVKSNTEQGKADALADLPASQAVDAAKSQMQAAAANSNVQQEEQRADQAAGEDSVIETHLPEKKLPVEQLDPNRYAHIYEEVDKGYPWTRPPKREPPPDPKWGEFERVYGK